MILLRYYSIVLVLFIIFTGVFGFIASENRKTYQSVLVLAMALIPVVIYMILK